MKRQGKVEDEQSVHVPSKRRKCISSESPLDTASNSTADSSSSSSDAAAIVNFRVSKQSVSALRKKGIETFFPIQKRSFDPIFDGKHVVGRARTGTGKTLAFALPSVERLLESDAFCKKGTRHRRCRMIVLLPTRELAQQVAADFELLQCGNRYGTTTLVGGLPEQPQIRSLRDNGNIVVGTPGRVLDFLNRKLLDLKKVRTVVLDEADQMLEMGFKEDVDKILRYLFEGTADDQAGEVGSKVQVLLFTATLPGWVQNITNQYMSGREKVIIDVVKGEVNQTATGISHLNILCEFHQRAKCLADVISLYARNNGRCIVFTETKAQANQIAVDSGISHICQVLHGDIAQKQREVTLKAFKEGRFRCLVATDVAARGLHVDDIELVVQMEPPKDVDTFVHRSGRTGRAGTSGINIVFHSHQDSTYLRSIEKVTGIRFRRVGVPQSQELMKAAAKRFVDNINQKAESDSYKMFKAVADEALTDKDPTEVVSRLLFELSGANQSNSATISALSGREGFKTYEVVFKNVTIQTKAYVFNALKNALGPSSYLADKLCSMTLRSDRKGCVFDVPPECLEEWEGCVQRVNGVETNSTSFSLALTMELPELETSVLESASGHGSVDTRNPRYICRYGQNKDGRGVRGGRGARSYRGGWGGRGGRF